MKTKDTLLNRVTVLFKIMFISDWLIGLLGNRSSVFYRNVQHNLLHIRYCYPIYCLSYLNSAHANRKLIYMFIILFSLSLCCGITLLTMCNSEPHAIYGSLSNKLRQRFERKSTPNIATKYRTLLSRIDKSARESEFEYSIIFGSLHAYAQTGEFCRWDDDHDIMIPIDLPLQKYQKFVKELNYHGLSIYYNNGTLGHSIPYKIFFTNSRPRRNKPKFDEPKPYSYPFVDVFYYYLSADNTTITVVGQQNHTITLIPNEPVFDTISFGGLKLRAPKSELLIDRMLTQFYGENWCNYCAVKGWSHVTESIIGSTLIVDCKSVLSYDEMVCLRSSLHAHA